MTSSTGNSFRVTGHLCGEFTGPRWIPHTKASDAGLWCFFDLRPGKRLSKHSWGWWFETPSHSLCRYRNVITWYHIQQQKTTSLNETEPIPGPKGWLLCVVWVILIALPYLDCALMVWHYSGANLNVNKIFTLQNCASSKPMILCWQIFLPIDVSLNWYVFTHVATVVNN